MRNHLGSPWPLLARVAVGHLAVWTAAVMLPPALGVDVVLTGSDSSSSTTSFNGTGHWDPAVAPSAGYNYFSNGFYLRTPNVGQNYAFGGDSLTLDGGTLAYSTPGDRTITINDLRMGGGSVAVWVANATMTLAGNVTLLDGTTSTLNGDQTGRTLSVTAPISGNGNLIAGSTIVGGGRTILSGANTYTGGTTVSGGTLRLQGGDNRLPTGTTVRFGGTATLELGGAAQTIHSMTFANNVTATVAGDGSVAVNGAAHLEIGPYQTGNTGATGIGAVTLNMADLDAFSYQSPEHIFRVGLQHGTQGSYASGTTVATATLADTNAITAAGLRISDVTANGGGGRSFLYLGRENTVNASTILVAASGRSSATLAFAPGLTNPSAHFRGTNGTSAVSTWNIGQTNNYRNDAWNATVDFSAGTLDALVNNMTIGNASDRHGTLTGSFTMGAGTLDVVNTITLGAVDGSQSGTRSGTGTFTLDGGTVKVATLTLANNTATGGTVSTTGTFNLLSGTLHAATIQRGDGSGTADFNWHSGTIGNLDAGTDLTISSGLNSIVLAGTGLHAFDISEGRTGTVHQMVSGGGTLTKVGAGTLTLSGANTYAGGTSIGAGTLRLQGGDNRLPTGTTVTLGGGMASADVGHLDMGDVSQTISALRFLSNTAMHNTVTIGAGRTLTLNGTGSLKLGQSSPFEQGRTTNATFTGGGALVVGNAGGIMDVGIRNNGQNNPGNNAALDLRALGSFTANVDQLRVSYDSRIDSTLYLSDTANAITANAIQVSNSLTNNAHNGLIVLGEGTNVLQADTINLGRGKGFGTIRFASQTPGSPGTVTIADKAGTGGANITLASNDGGGTGANLTGTLDLRGHQATITAGTILAGRRNANSDAGNATGTIWFDQGTFAVQTLQLGVQSGTGTGTATGILNIGGGTFTVGSNVELAARSGSGSAVGTIHMTGGTLNVNGNVTDGGGTSTVNLQGGTMNVAGGNLIVDSLFVGRNGGAAALHMTGSAVQLGSAANPTNLYVGRRDVETATTFQGTLDLSGATTLTAHLSDFFVGTATSVTVQQGQPRGVVTLAESNVIHAQNIVISHSPGVGLGGFNNRVILGTHNTIMAQTLLVGGDKSSGPIGGSLQFGPGGGTLNLGTQAERVNAYVGRQVSATGGGASGHLNMAVGTFNAYIDHLLVGSKGNNATGTTTGMVTFEAGTLDVNTITLGERTNAGSQGHVQGTFNLLGGTLKAGSILKGEGNGNGANDLAAFNFTGGTLHVGTFGSAADHFTLNQQGGTLAPGNSVGTTTIYGDYHQAAAGILEIELEGIQTPGVDYDLVAVHGDATLLGSLDVVFPGSFRAQLGDSFDVLTTTGSLSIWDDDTMTGLTLTGAPPNDVFGWWDLAVVTNPNGGEILRLSAVPEPTAWLMLLSAIACGLLVRRQK